MHKPSLKPFHLALTGRQVVLLLAVLLAEVLLLVLALAKIVDHAWWQSLFLGIVEGLTEFLPISSTGHLLITAKLIRFEHGMGGTFEIFIQLGAILAIIAFYARDLLAQIKAVRHEAAIQRFWLNILIAFSPAAVLGLTLHSWIKKVLFDSPPIIAFSLIGGGLIFLLVEYLPQKPLTAQELTAISPKQALGIGIAQTFALIPGVSRSGASIIGGMLAGLDRPTATAFSFYLAIPTLGAATVVDLLKSLDQLVIGDFGFLFIGTLVSGLIAWLSIGWLLRYVSTNNFVAFGVYRLCAGVLILLLGFGKFL